MWGNTFYTKGDVIVGGQIFVIEDMLIDIEATDSDIDLSIEQSMPEIEIEIEVTEDEVSFDIQSIENKLEINWKWKSTENESVSVTRKLMTTLGPF